MYGLRANKNTKCFLRHLTSMEILIKQGPKRKRSPKRHLKDRKYNKQDSFLEERDITYLHKNITKL